MPRWRDVILKYPKEFTMKQAIIETVFVFQGVHAGKEAHSQNAPKTSKTMDAGGTHSIVDSIENKPGHGLNKHCSSKILMKNY